MITLPSLFLLSLSSYAPQTVGGGDETLYSWLGTVNRDNFGEIVDNAGDVNGDGYSDIIVGAASMSTAGLDNNGAAFVYSGADGSLLYQFDGLADEDQFGDSVAGAGDVNADGYADVIIGAYSTKFGNDDLVGTSYVYSGLDGSLLHTWSGTAAGDFHGDSVDGAGDVDGDGFDDLIVAETEANAAGMTENGNVYVYSGATGSVLYQWWGSANYNYFGSDVAGAGDLNADGYDDVIIGAFGTEPNGLIWAGSAYAYSGADGSLLYQWDGNAAVDYFGKAVNAAGDINSDGFDDVIVGATNSDTGVYNSGSTYVYSGADGSLLYQFDGLSNSEYSGGSVAGGLDFNGDGIPDLVVGAENAYLTGVGNSGAAYLYSGADGSLLHLWMGTEYADWFGSSVSMLGDVTQDGRAEVIIGARGAGPVAEGRTVVYTFNPYLTSNSGTISAASGGVLTFDFDFPDAAAAQNYKLLISQTGTGPTNYGVDIPLTNDSTVVASYLGNYPVPTHSNLHGVLDAQGNGSGSLTVPGGLPANLIGKTFYLAAIAEPSGALPAFSSAALSVVITP
ncbi:MAG: FG-GAP repeat protein [Planctomycetes bacterium]|nr:FG-GAP repeat protein [Planctomycetota bacterium]